MLLHAWRPKSGKRSTRPIHAWHLDASWKKTMATSPFAHEQPISKFLGSDYVFDIPGFQKPYAWNNEQARDPLDDDFRRWTGRRGFTYRNS